MTEEQLEPIGGGILNNEIKLCDKMLMADERNFHCWNYRSWVINTQLDQYDEIEKAQASKAKESKNADEKETEGASKKKSEEIKAYVASEMKMKKLKQEFEMTTGMIEKNFSNFSAWHYRSKLMLKIHKKNGSQYKIPLDLIKEELDKIKHAIFTEPNDQSPWNDHRWLVSLLIPVYILKQEIKKDERVFNIQFSEVVFDSLVLKATINGKETELKSTTKKPESKYFSLAIPEDIEINDNLELEITHCTEDFDILK